jgi:hypothetical protein
MKRITFFIGRQLEKQGGVYFKAFGCKDTYNYVFFFLFCDVIFWIDRNKENELCHHMRLIADFAGMIAKIQIAKARHNSGLFYQ